MTRLESLLNQRAHLIALADVARAKGEQGAADCYCEAAMDAGWLLELEQRAYAEYLSNPELQDAVSVRR